MPKGKGYGMKSSMKKGMKGGYGGGKQTNSKMPMEVVKSTPRKGSMRKGMSRSR